MISSFLLCTFKIKPMGPRKGTFTVKSYGVKKTKRGEEKNNMKWQTRLLKLVWISASFCRFPPKLPTNKYTYTQIYTHTENVHIFDDDKQDPVKVPSLLPLAIGEGTKLRNWASAYQSGLLFSLKDYLGKSGVILTEKEVYFPCGLLRLPFLRTRA